MRNWNTAGSGTEPAKRFRPTHAWSAVRLQFKAAPGALLVQLGLTMVSAVLPVGSAWFTKIFFDSLTHSPRQGIVVAAAVAIAATNIATGIASLVIAYAGRVMRGAVRKVVHDTLLRRVNSFVGLRKFESPPMQNGLRLAEQAGEQAPIEITNSLVTVVKAIIQLTAWVVALAAVWPPMIPLLVIGAVPAVFLQLRNGRRRVRLIEGESSRARKISFFHTLLTQPTAGQEVRLFGLGDFLRERLLKEVRVMIDADNALERRVMVSGTWLLLINGLSVAFGTVVVALKAGTGGLGAGDVSVFLSSIVATQGAVIAAVGSGGTLYSQTLLFGHYRKLMDEADEDVDGTVVARTLRHNIEFKDVWFRYPGDGSAWALRGVNLVIPVGATVGLVGLNGAGKTTLIKLLCRMYEPTAGCILWDGVDIREFSAASLRARIGVVFQDFMTYDLTAAENIGVGHLPSLTDSPRIRAAASAAGINEDLEKLPGGYDTLLSRTLDPDSGAAAATLSGGQWQRVAIARTFLRADCDLMILDEHTSRLDAEAESNLRARLGRLREGRTSLIISHRLSTFRTADRVFVLADGVIVEEGGHEELMNIEDGRYAQLFTLQSAGYAEVENHSVG